MAQAIALHGGASSFAARGSDYSGKSNYSGKFDSDRNKARGAAHRAPQPAVLVRTSPPPAKRSPQQAGRALSPVTLTQSRETESKSRASEDVRRGVPSDRSERSAAAKPEPQILFQKYFKSIGPRTYAAQLKKAANGNHFLVLTEGKRDEKTEDIRKTKIFVFSEDFGEFFRMLHETAKFIRENPVPDEIRQKRQRFWAKQSAGVKRGDGSSHGSRVDAAASKFARPSQPSGASRIGRPTAKR
jgi:hypothetical protein